VGDESNGPELAWFSQVSMKEGVQAGKAVLDWAAKSNVKLTKIALTSGEPEQVFAQGRMKGFRTTIQAAMPDVVFVNDESNALNVTLEMSKAYDTDKAFIVGHPDVQVIFNTDLTGASIDRAIVDTGNKGKMYSIAWNPSYEQLDYVDSGVQIAVMDQKWSDQGGYGALACATFFAEGKILPNTQVLTTVTKENSAQSRAELQQLLGTPAPS